MWDKIVAGAPEGKTSKIPSSLLKKMKIQLPYMPEIINYIGCAALKPCGGLYVPCGGKSVEGIQYCGTCMKSGAKFGTLLDRGAPGTYTDPSDKREISYGTWLAKNEIIIQDVHEMLHEQGFTFRIPEEYLTVNAKRAAPAKRRPGRPGVVKKTVVNDDGSESPQGSSLDGFDHKVILKGNESDVSALSDDEAPVAANIVAAKVAARKAEEYAENVTAAFECLDIGKVKKLSKEEKAAAAEEKALAKAAKEAAKKLKDDEKAREKELAAAQKQIAGDSKKKDKAPKEEKAPKEVKASKEEKAPKEEKAKKEKKAPSPKPAPSKRKESPKAVLEKDESEDEETEEIVIDGEEYALVGNNVFDEDGTHVGTKVDGKIEWNEESIAGKRHMNR